MPYSHEDCQATQAVWCTRYGGERSCCTE